MILHIVKKDWRLLRWLVIGLAALAILAELARYQLHAVGYYGHSQPLDILLLLGWAALIVAAVHQDAIPGTRQDWLTRPIERFDLLAAKLVFVLLLVQAPSFIANVTDVLASGFSLPQAIGAAAARGASLFVAVTLVALALAAVTKNMYEFIIQAIVLAVLVEIAVSIIGGLTGVFCAGACGTGMSWISTLASFAVLATFAAAVLVLQYFKRGATQWSYVLLAVGAIGMALAYRLPWSTALALQQRVTGTPSVASNVAVAIDLNRTNVVPPDVNSAEYAEVLRARSSLMGEASDEELRALLTHRTEGRTAALPISVMGRRNGTVLWADRIEARLVDANGNVLYARRADELPPNPGLDAVQTLFVESWFLERFGARTFAVELDYAFTQLEPAGELVLPAAGGEARFASNERCSTEPLRNRSAVRMHCVTLQRPPCYSVAAEQRSTGARGAERLICAPDYAPFKSGTRLFDSFALDVPFAAGAELDDWFLRYTAYEASEHFERQVRTPQLNLTDWLIDGR